MMEAILKLYRAFMVIFFLTAIFAFVWSVIINSYLLAIVSGVYAAVGNVYYNKRERLKERLRRMGN